MTRRPRQRDVSQTSYPHLVLQLANDPGQVELYVPVKEGPRDIICVLPASVGNLLHPSPQVQGIGIAAIGGLDIRGGGDGGRAVEGEGVGNLLAVTVHQPHRQNRDAVALVAALD